MGNEKDVFEWRRFGHWTSNAEKAWFSSYLLWHTQDQDKLNEVICDSNYKNGDGALAVIEAFHRESSVALELIIKAVIARNMEARLADPATEGVPANHNIPSLWRQANLPNLPREDKYRLLRIKKTLMWSGRYATPRTVEAWEKENKEFASLEDPPTKSGKFVIRKPITIGWSDFDRLYQIAKANL